jgi:hypothetical protein
MEESFGRGKRVRLNQRFGHTQRDASFPVTAN